MFRKPLIFIKLFSESVRFATASLAANKLRTFLSLLGVTIGIFSIITIFSITDSIENQLRESIESLGSNVVYVDKWPWEFKQDYPWWKYKNRPDPELSELYQIMDRTRKAQAGAFKIETRKTVQYGNNYSENVAIQAVTYDYDKIKSFNIRQGRYFTPSESNNGYNAGIIGTNIKDALFQHQNAVGKTIKIAGRKVRVIGVFEKEGEDITGQSLDNIVLLPVSFASRMIDIRKVHLHPQIIIRAKPDISYLELMDELRGIMRAVRRLSPKAEDNFALNQASLITKSFNSLFDNVKIIGGFIAFFAILVGGFGIANIMFVSVKERTRLIGIQKALGAKQSFILWQFLYEAVVLSLIGGFLGLLFIFIGINIAASALEIDLFLSIDNVILGIVISAVTGLIAGFVPAWSASRLNPVEAINSPG